MTNEEESEILGVPLHSPAFQFERTTRSESGTIVEFVRSIYRGDRYRLVTELSRRDRVGRGAGIPAPRSRRRERRAGIGCACGTRREAPGRDPRAAGRAPTAARARRRVRGRGRGGRDRGPRPRADGRARLVRQRGLVRRLRVRPAAGAGRRCATRSRSRSTTAPRSTSAARAVLALSQSGQTPDVARVRRARAGARRVHDRGHERARLRARRLRPSVVLPLAAGPERAIAATKTYTNAGRGARAPRGLRGRRGAASSRTASGARADLLEELLPALERRVCRARGLARVRRPHVRDRPRARSSRRRARSR